MDQLAAFFIIILVLGLLALVVVLVVRASKPRGAASPSPPLPRALPAPYRPAALPALALRPHVLRDIDFLRKLIQTLALPPDRAAAFTLRLTQLEARASRTDLHLAVVGEFNSGKSTFINAMLRRPLLKVDNRATTAAATTIRYGKELALSVQLLDGTSASGTERNPAGLAALLKTAPAGPARSLAQWIDLTTADPNVSRSIRALALEVPAAWLGRGVCIIDTPGVGAGADNAHHHQAVTDRVLALEADAIVVLIAAQSTVTGTLLKFLGDTARPFLERCVFIVTKIDGIEDDERAAVLGYITKELTGFLGAPPHLFHADARAVLLAGNASTTRLGEQPSRAETEFAALENSLHGIMSRQAPEIIADSLLGLLRDLLGELKAEINNRQSLLIERQKQLDANAVQNLKLVLENLSRACLAFTETRVHHTRQAIADGQLQHRLNAERRVGEYIDNLVFGNLRETIEGHIPRVLGEEGAAFNQLAGGKTEALKNDYRTAHGRFILGFEHQYQNLKSLGIPHLAQKLAAPPLPTPSADPASLMKTTPFENGPRWRDFLGIGVRKEHTRQKSRAAILPGIDRYFLTMATVWQFRINVIHKEMKTALQASIQSHIKRYDGIVQAMIAEHHRTKVLIEQQQRALRGSAAELDARIAGLRNVRIRV